MTEPRGRIFLLAGLLDDAVLAGFLLPDDFTVVLLVGFPAGFPVVLGAVGTGFASVATGCEGLS